MIGPAEAKLIQAQINAAKRVIRMVQQEMARDNRYLSNWRLVRTLETRTEELQIVLDRTRVEELAGREFV